MSDFLNDFVTAIREERLKKGWSQAQAAKKVGVTQTAFYRYEKGVLPKDSAGINKLAEIFGLTLAVLRNDNIDAVLHAAGYEVEWERNHLIASKNGHRWVCYPDD